MRVINYNEKTLSKKTFKEEIEVPKPKEGRLGYNSLKDFKIVRILTLGISKDVIIAPVKVDKEIYNKDGLVYNTDDTLEAENAI